MIKVTLDVIINSQGPLQTLMAAQLPIAISYRLSRAMRQINEELKEFYATHKVLVEKYGEHDNEGKLIIDKENNSIPICTEYQELFQSEMAKLLAVEIHIDIEPINILELNNVNISAQELYWLEKFLIVG